MTRHQPLSPRPGDSLSGARAGLPVDPRADAILAQARQAFIDKGFDGASMQDLARAAGMSAGNFYRYFNSKAALVEALVARDLDQIEGDFAVITGSADPIGALRAVLRRRLEDDRDNGFPLWAEIMAAAARKPEIAAACARMEADILDKIIHVLSVGCGIPPQRGAARFAAPARLILLLVQGAGMQGCIAGRLDADLRSLILQTIDRLIDDATTVPPKVPS
jgi:AcrR family transcriptional regulator